MGKKSQKGSAVTRNAGKPWFSQIRDELERRDKQCQTRFGPINEYVRPPVDPYKFPSVESFKRAYPFITANGINCKIIKPALSTKDPHNRYYDQPRHKSQCKKLGGIWQEDVNRKNKYDVCVS